MSERNALKKDTARFIIFREDDEWYGIALEFGVVVTENTPEAVYASLATASKGYLDSVKEGNLRPFRAKPLLNKDANSEYEQLWGNFQEKKDIPSPIKISLVGTLAVV